MGFEHLDALHGLSVSLGWPHRRADWETNLQIGHGIVAVDALDRVHGSAMYFPYQGDLTSIGMVIAHPKLARTSLFGTLAHEMIDRSTRSRSTGGVFLNACKNDVASYRDLGMRADLPVYKYEGILPCDFSIAREVRKAEAQDLQAIYALDGESYEADRRALLAVLADRSDCYVIEARGQITGFGMRRRFGRGTLIGPVTATGSQDAIRLTTSLMAGLAGRFVRLDTRLEEGPYTEFLTALGLKATPDVTTMSDGQPKFHPQSFAISSHSTG
ncbi:hypothetical protein ABEB22_06820 [Thioclava sp. 'Guangxiensis']